jgi:UDP-glucuronate 4-epimerase
MTKKVLVTGGAGFIGSHVAEALRRRGDRVVVLDNFNDFYDPAIKRHNADAVARAGARVVEGDFCDADTVARLFGEHELTDVIHLGAYAGVIPSVREPGRYARANVLGTTVLLDAAVRFGIRRFVMASSSSVYGNNRKVPFAEDDSVDAPISPYAATKRSCELIGHTFSHLHDLPVSALRFFTAYGPRQRPDLAVHLFMRKIAAGEPITIFGDGSMSRDFTFIGDIAAGVLAALDRCGDTERFRVYNLGGSSPVRVDELVAAIEETLEATARIEHRPERPGDVKQTYADLTRSRAELEYEPTTSLPQGLAAQWRWMREAGVAAAPPRSTPGRPGAEGAGI